MTLPNPDIFFSLRDVTWEHLCNGFRIIATTDVPCHLWLRWTTVEPQLHTVPRYRRGIYLNSERYICFVAYKDNEQEEAGDTYIHTFTKRNWPVCERRYFNFWGTIAGVVCRSTTAYFTLHFDIVHLTIYAQANNRTIRGNHIDWDTCHDLASGFMNAWHEAPNYILVAGAGLTVSYWLWRSYLAFNTSIIPTDIPVYDGFLEVYLFSKLFTSSVLHPNITITKGVQHDPVCPPDYGAQLPYTEDGGSIALGDMVADQYNSIQLNAYGASLINTTGITKFCLRGQQDIEDVPPPLGTNQAAYHSYQKGRGYWPRLTVCHRPP